MKIERHGIKEENKITAFWLYEFAYDLEKNAQNIDYLKDYLSRQNKSKDFNNIEDKLADIRSRVGLDLAIKLSNEIDNQVHLASVKDSCCGINQKCSCKTKIAQAQHSERDISIMNNILKYIRDMVKHEPHLDSAVIISKCKNEEGLRFNDLESKIDHTKLIKYINDLLGINNPANLEQVSYTPSEAITEYDADDRIAEYYNHAEPYRS